MSLTPASGHLSVVTYAVGERVVAISHGGFLG